MFKYIYIMNDLKWGVKSPKKKTIDKKITFLTLFYFV